MSGDRRILYLNDDLYMRHVAFEATGILGRKGAAQAHVLEHQVTWRF